MGEYMTRDQAEAEAPAESGFPGAGSYIVAVLFPIIGVVLGIVALAKGKVGPGFALFATSALAIAVYLAIFTA